MLYFEIRYSDILFPPEIMDTRGSLVIPLQSAIKLVYKIDSEQW